MHKALAIGCPKCGDKRSIKAWTLEAVEIERRNPSTLDAPIACYTRGCRLRHAHLFEGDIATLTLPGERKPSRVVTYRTIAKRVTVRDVLRILREGD